MIVDNRAEYFAKTAHIRAADEGAFWQRFYHGRLVQARIQPKNLDLSRLMELGAKPKPTADVVPIRRVVGAQ